MLPFCNKTLGAGAAECGVRGDGDVEQPAGGDGAKASAPECTRWAGMCTQTPRSLCSRGYIGRRRKVACDDADSGQGSRTYSCQFLFSPCGEQAPLNPDEYSALRRCQFVWHDQIKAALKIKI